MAAQFSHFMGAKLALFVGDRLLSLQRDNTPGLLWSGFWALPGGGREADESPIECALRETRGELSLAVPPAQITWGRSYTNSIGRSVWFFAGWMPEHIVSDIALGDEGQGWSLWAIEAFLSHDKVVPQFKTRLSDYLTCVAPEPFK